MRWLAAAAVTALPFCAVGQVQCPLELPQSAMQIKAPAGWTAIPDAVPLTGFGMFETDPGGPLYLIPSDMKDNKKETEGTWFWEFQKGEAWLYCTYGFTEAIRISRRVATSPKKCSVSYKKNFVRHIESLVATCER